jgi:hypothetical protein
MVVIPVSKTSCLWRHTLQLWRSLIVAGAVGEDPLDRRVPESALLTKVTLRSSLDCRLLFDLALSAIWDRALLSNGVQAMSDLVEFRHLKYIVAVAETANFTRAAERLFLAQPSLSQQIKDLVDEIEFPIYVLAIR